jgi:hypothetical protein
MSSAPNLLRVLIALRTFSYEIEPESSNLKSLSQAVTPDTKLFFGEDLRLGCWGGQVSFSDAPLFLSVHFALAERLDSPS